MIVKKGVRTVFVLLFIFLSLLCLSAMADMPSIEGKQDHIKEIYERAMALSPEVLDAAEGSIAHPHSYLKVNKQFIPLNSVFWDLVRGWIRLYRSEIHKYCSCNINEHELVQEAKDQIAKGFFNSKIKGPLFNFGEYLIIEGYGLAAKYGRTALVMKVTSEVVEHLLKPLSVLCNVIDFMIVFILRKSQIYSRVFSNSGTVNKNRISMLSHLAYKNRLMKKVRKGVFFYLESVAIDQEALALVDEEGIKKGKRSKWVRTLSKKTTPILNQMREIDVRLEDETLSKRKRAKLFKKREKLSKKIRKLTTVSRKDFLGKRYKVFLFLLSRKWKKRYLKGKDASDRFTATNWLWSLALQENILERVFISQEGEANLFQTDKTTALKKDEIRNGLAEEFVEKMQTNTDKTEHVRSVERVLMDIEKIFDPSLTTKERYLLVSAMEAVFDGFFEHYLRLIHKRLSQTTSDMSTIGKGKLRYRLDRVVHHFFVYSDFLRTVAFVKDKTKINSYKYESMELFLLFFEHMNKLHQLSHLRHHIKAELFAKLEQNLQRIQSFQVHLEKRTAFSWIPFSMPVPYCRNLARVSN